MKIIGTYATKTKWQVRLDAKGLPISGYDYEADRDCDSIMPPKENILIHGALMLIGTARGRSSAHVVLGTADGWRGHTTLTGAAKMFESIAEGLSTIRHETWDVRTVYPRNPTFNKVDRITGAVIEGYWTMAKQGTELSLIPAPSSIIP
ncbi:hypothetical protein vBRpoSV10_110 [Ruegeria phage vB_RpoS-V10]|nr:hypothetical protein DSS3P8_109 [Roseobacter phage DSS3P8]AWY09232.1 hypothetical protein vBRpoSV10_110 [Ruegeria phage vB_RpoS-V10]